MAWHTIREAVELTGRSRRSLYRDINSGLVSSEVGLDGQRRFETSELIRAYGPLVPVAHLESPKVAQVGTVPEGVLDVAALVVELRELKEEVRDLKETMRRLEHKPEPQRFSEQEVFPLPAKIQPQESITWADLLTNFDTDKK